MAHQSEKSNISRRDFIHRATVGTTALAFTPAINLWSNPAVSPWPKGAGDYTIHMIGHGHIDPVWLWPWSEGVSIVHSTFRSALDRMKETPDVVFAASSARFYQWVADNDPAMLNEIRQRVKEGRWNVVGGWWVEPDMNLPSGEAMVRQGLYGQRTLQKLIGTRAKVAFNPDAFGHAEQYRKLSVNKEWKIMFSCVRDPMRKQFPRICFGGRELMVHAFWPTASP